MMPYRVFGVLGKYFDEISQDTGRYCFGVDDTLKALEMGAIETLIVWENLEVTRFVVKDHSTESKQQPLINEFLTLRNCVM